MALTWRQFGDTWRGFDDRYLAATVVRYDAPEPPHWTVSVRLERLPGRHATADAAMAAADQAHAAAR